MDWTPCIHELQWLLVLDHLIGCRRCGFVLACKDWERV